uniref:Uncharacterized protein n=1 Tax=Rhizophora mucronata TaxID=61149 RepID=A0A2P2NNL8_RHIMU
MASCLTEDSVPLPSYYNNNFYGSDQPTVMDPQSETSTLVSHNSNHSFSLAASILSTPSSSSTPLNSNSTTYINGNSSSHTEDELESYCSNLLKLEFSDIFDVSNFM